MKKYALGLLLCLNIGCKEIIGGSEKEVSPDDCVAMALPSTKVAIKGFRSGMQYQTLMNGKVLWDECRRGSEFTTYGVHINPTIGTNGEVDITVPANIVFKGYYYDIMNADHVNIQVFEQDSQCNVSTGSVLDQNVEVKETNRFKNPCFTETEFAAKAEF